MSGVQSSASDSATDVEHGAVTAGKAPAVEPPPSKLHAWWAKWYAGVLFGSALTIVFLTVVIVIVIVSNPVNNTTNPHVKLDYTTYVGKAVSDNIDRYLGVRYAAAPVGDLRWRAPQDPPKSDSRQLVDEFENICLTIDTPYPTSGHDEDCLYMNIWTPSNATAKSKLPVWLFIQGGGYVSLSNANWDGAEVVKNSGHNIVFVEFNYRVGLWGFLASEKVRQDGDLNVGLLDQRAAMKWVQKYISHFGGDPNHVVIHGASAGAGSVALHLTAYGGRDDSLFAGGMAESVFFPAQPYLADLEWQFEKVVEVVGCSNATDEMSCLRGKDVATLQAANAASGFPGRSEYASPLFYWTPCIDGDLIEDIPYTMFEKGDFIKVPILFGNDNDEGSIFASNAATKQAMVSFLQNNYPLLRTNDTAAILSNYPQMEALPGHSAWYPSAALAYGEATFICPTVNILDAYSAHWGATDSDSDDDDDDEPPLWSYRFNAADQTYVQQGLGVPHLSDAAAVFGPDSIGGNAPPGYYTYNADIVPVMQAYWLSFVQELDPNPRRNASAPAWEPWGANRSRLLFETGASRMEDTPAAQVRRCEFWEGLKDVMLQK